MNLKDNDKTIKNVNIQIFEIIIKNYLLSNLRLFL